MSTTSVERLSETRVKLHITVPATDLGPSIKHAYEHIAEQVSIPGFRKGKVPAPIIDQRVGREEVLSHAVNEGLDGFFREALISEKLTPIGRPEADITEWPEVKDFSGELKITITVDVRPEIKLPDLEKIKIEVEPSVVSADDVQNAIDELRQNFSDLVEVERPAKTGDVVSLNLQAKIGDKVVDTANGVLYDVGSGELLEGLDEAIDSLSAGEETSFTSVLLGGEHEGQEAVVEVQIAAVQEKSLPELNDDFAKLTGEFETVKELKEKLKEQLQSSKLVGVATEARQKLVESLIAAAKVTVPQNVIDDEVVRHLASEGREDDTAHGEEVAEQTRKSLSEQFVLDALSETLEVKVENDDLANYLIQLAQRYGATPQELANTLQENGQMNQAVSDVARSKALSVALNKVQVVDSKGKAVDLSPVLGNL